MMTRTTPIIETSKNALGIICMLLVLVACSTGPPNSSPKSHATDPRPSAASIVLVCGEGAQFEIIGPQGQRVLIDVTDPSYLSRPADENDLLLTTHFHFDHYNQTFIDTFPGERMQDRQGEILRPGLSIKGIAGFHTEQYLNDHNPAVDNYLFVVETGGIRIAHFGDIGQKELTADQLKILGRIDIAITQFVNPYSQMSLENKKGYSLMEQLRPKIIIPHHGAGTDGAIRLAMARWRVLCAKGNRLTLSPRSLPDQTTVILMGEMANYMQKTFGLKVLHHLPDE